MTLRVKLEIVPFGDETQAREIGRLDISNTGLIAPDGYVAYNVLDLSPGQEGEYDELVYHIRNHGAWRLVSQVLLDCDITGPQ